MANNGYLGWTKLKKVIDGGDLDGDPLDENNNRPSSSGLPQAKKDNISSDPDYIAPEYNEGACPVNNDVSLFMMGSYNGAEIEPGFEFSATISEPLDNNLTVTFTSTYIKDGFGSIGPSSNITILSGEVLGSVFIAQEETGVIENVEVTVAIVSPNPNGTKTIIY